MMDDTDELDEDSFAFHPWNCDGCPPPYFDLPPPPRPDFLDDPDYCNNRNPVGDVGHAGSVVVSSPYDSCDNPVIVDSNFHFESDLLNIIAIVISSIVLVLLILLTACFIWR